MSTSNPFTGIKVAALAGGVGGARLAQGLAAWLPAGNLSIIVNTGDDFEHLGLTICPDLDTVLYTLSGLANPETGWGLAGDTFASLEAIERLGGPSWFRLGDRDMATHIERTRLLREGLSLTEVTARFARALGVKHAILPMSDSPCRTIVLTDQGEMEFQTYFVRHHCEPKALGFRWKGVESAVPTARVLKALESADLVIFCPSNPFVSIDPIINLPGVRSVVQTKTSLALSPIIGGAAVKGPAAKMFIELGMPSSATAVARRYHGLLRGFMLDEVDRSLLPEVEALGMDARAIPSLMPTLTERKAVAQGMLAFGLELLGRG